MRICLFLALVSFLVLPLDVLAGEDPTPEQKILLDRIDALFDKGKEQNYEASGMDTLKESLDLCLNTLKENPDDYDLLWRCTRSAYKYGEAAEILQVEEWREICREWGERGIEFAERAQKVEPEKVEGYFWETACVGIYADATGPITAVKEGFYDKSKTAMTKSYELDKSYNDYDPIFGSAMFYISLPFPLRDKKKALNYYREFKKNTEWKENHYVRCLHAANLLIKVKSENYKEEARKLLEKALSDPHPRKYYHEWALRLQKKVD